MELINLTVDPAATPDVLSEAEAFVGKLPAQPSMAPPPSAPTWRQAITLAEPTDESFAITTQVRRPSP